MSASAGSNSGKASRPVSWVIQAIFQSALNSGRNTIIDNRGKYVKVIYLSNFMDKLRQSKIVKSETGNCPELEDFLGSGNNYIDLRKLITVTEVFLKSHYLKSYGIAKNKLTA